MFCVGLTGNIGSGKSTAISIFKSLGAAVIIADDIAKELTMPNQPAFKLIKEHFGAQIITETGQLNRAQLRTIIFNHAEERIWLENLLHPLIRKQIMINVFNSQGPYAVIEIPLLYSRIDYPYLDRILVILADFKTQLARILQRDLCTEEQALAILATQSNETLRRELADDIVINDNSLEQLQHDIRKLHGKYLQLAIEKSS
ncbi:dephospho-CoA kinase [Legionella beliardensis]|uniref:Dephospho-CoA kinase n=2 Tax=Legionella beliardensis TaxID=91822 RepID=A0A378I1V4_9GAMM|nr:dephospho-CoA kinase [Legionella beliardensis]